jgi:hypothetical protein
MKIYLLSVICLLIFLSAYTQNDTLSPKELKTYLKKQKDKDFFEGFWQRFESGGIYENDKPLEVFVSPMSKVAILKKDNYLLVYSYNKQTNVYSNSNNLNSLNDTIFKENQEYYYYRGVFDVKSKITIKNSNTFIVILEKPNDYVPNEIEKINHVYTRKRK